MTHDYKALIKHMEDMAVRKGPDMELTGASIWLGPAGFAMVLHALKLADKIMQEPSEGMMWAKDAMNIWHTTVCECGAETSHGSSARSRSGLFKAMRDQMLKEIDNDASL